VNINRHNYEEFLLLYVDNELNTEDRAAVEEFLQQNADLAEELKMLAQTILPADNVAFEAKELLYKEAGGISLNNYEEYFLLSVDQELNEKQKEEVDKFVLNHPELQNQFALLSRTRLEPEKIEFVGKEKLFRKTAGEKPVIFLSWMRLSVAAAVIGLVAITWFFSQDNSSSPATPPVVINEKTKKPSQELVASVKPKDTVVDRNVALVQENKRLKSQTIAPRKTELPKVAEPKSGKDLIAVKEKQKAPEKLEEVAGKPMKVAEDLQSRKAFEDAIASARIVNGNKADPIKDEPKTTVFANNTDQSTSLASHTVYKELDTRENDEENTFYLGSAEINKHKLKGLLKKATGFFDRKNNNNDGERTLKIAGFEIKSK
jgi:hypothetical protein